MENYTKFSLRELLELAINLKASDLHLSQGLAPIVRIDGDLVPLDLAPMEFSDLRRLLAEKLSPTKLKELETRKELDFLFEEELLRCRVSVFFHSKGLALALRLLPLNILSLQELGLPKQIQELLSVEKGLFLVTGPTGSGKSTTLAAMLDFLNQRKKLHVITIEDPIEFVHKSKNCLIHQREVPRDTENFNSALKAALREDPDVILIGELRDLETIRLALRAAETGHLVLASLHTCSAAKTINRILEIFPGPEQALIRSVVSDSLRLVIAQDLEKKPAGGRIALFEIMISNPAIRNLIRENKIAQIYSCMQTGRAQGMQTMEQALEKYHREELRL